jgi:hypothetical protein
MVRLEAEVKQITHAIRMAACNAETLLARGLDGHYARAGDEAYALIREALTASGDICPGNGQLLIRLDPLTAPRRTQALAALCDQLNHAQASYPGTDLVLRYEVKPHPGTAGNNSLCQESWGLARARKAPGPPPERKCWPSPAATQGQLRLPVAGRSRCRAPDAIPAGAGCPGRGRSLSIPR